MAEARAEAEWERTAWLIGHIVHMVTGKKVDASDYMPQKRPRNIKPLPPEASGEALKALARAAGATGV